MNQKVNILYLDDDRENLVGFAATFGKLYNIFEAQTFQEAQNILSEHDIQIAIIDFKMPEMDGVDFINMEQKRAPHIIFIIISAYTDASIVIKAINQHNIYGYIQKPWNYDEVAIMLKNASNVFIERKEKAKLNNALKEKNRQLKKAIENEHKANNLKNVFLENISHEIRTPLNSILGFNQLIANTTDTNKLSAYAKCSVDAGYDLLELINSILEGAKLITDQIVYHMTRIGLNDLITEAVEIMEQKCSPRPNFNTQLEKNNNILVDHEKFIQLLVNILDNAVKYGENKPVEITSATTENAIQLKIVDHGCGMDKIEIESIFEPFNQTKERLFAPKKGIGMGLFIAKKHIENMNGQLAVSSVLGEGSTFIISMPLPEKRLPDASSSL
ncbi:Cell-division control histidine kinase PdhS [Salinivirga cyanobacteriivorans]|uniref:histidine kinase n=1 Tax=Salinivirga cyanobacteriivorans TaxID=1307839 RepID=A0A0S2I3Q3_9BACT|nr:hybrid sensor histidine kinase/response regulator [Salinivirga cyanobacteriivorans]ALO16945.1 Cell-division control histidine kinase PdhS [Salinivirga cyanobacteriivorans]